MTYFGGKSTVAGDVWAALGQPKTYIEPFFGSGAVLLARPGYDPEAHSEIVCDKDGHVANVWRAIKFAPDEVAYWCDWPVNHADLNARRRFMIKNEGWLLENLHADPEWCDPKLAGYWIWAASCWIGSGLTRPDAMPQLTYATGIHTAGGKRPHLPDTGHGKGIHTAGGQVPQLDCAKGIHTRSERIYEWLDELSARLRKVSVVCGDWSRVCGGNWQDNAGIVGMFFDPPYDGAGRTKVYHHDSTEVWRDVNEWCLKRGSRLTYRIVIAGYEEHMNLTEHGWTTQSWSAGGGYSNRRKSANQNRHRETLYLSPHCMRQEALEL